mmetsp:Transcript_10181/g.25475  ORF Transcript_10181/g.25475 Transcript_10181/m.25475 type:complete len:200 (+) Transcript_10181:1221-1820(+)
MARAIHGLQEPFLPLDLEAVHVILVVLIMPGLFEELCRVDVWCDDLVEAALAILRTHQLLEPVVDPSAVVGPEARPGRHHAIEEEQVLLLADPPVIAFFRLLESPLVLLQLLRRREGDTVDALQRVIVCRSKPVSRRILHHREGLHAPSRWQVWPTAQVDQIAAAVCRGLRARSYLAGNQIDFEGVARKELQSLLSGNN